MRTQTCKGCGRFLSQNKIHICNFKKENHPYWKNGKTLKKIQKRCPYCKILFKTSFVDLERKRGLFCSVKCRILHKKAKEIKKNCLFCQKTFIIKSFILNKVGRGQFCSQSCVRKAKTGIEASHWKGGITPLVLRIRHSQQYIQWRTNVFQRDNYICQFCGIKGNQLCADHIYPFSLIIKELLQIYSSFTDIVDCELLWNLNNGRTLCVDCHKKTDTYLSKAINYKLPQEYQDSLCQMLT